jgi:hypothetical protein
MKLSQQKTLGIKASKKFVVKRKDINRSESLEEVCKFLCPTSENLPLLKTHYPGEKFQRVDKRSIVQRWTDEQGIDHHTFMFYPTPEFQKYLEDSESEIYTNNDYFLLLWKRLNIFGIAKYSDIPEDITRKEFDKYLNTNGIKRHKLITNGVKRYKLKVCTRFKLKVKK